ncbi:MAG: PHB depolymerase family esterase [Magnetococcales bacterium]|nr:PHB depolymerase family esterase [Magnetococcales bacterium]MBF0321636.1 PHB depolymerase family esterase [Magnetococcales bacterium]
MAMWLRYRWRRRIGLVMGVLWVIYLVVPREETGLHHVDNFSPNPGHVHMWLYLPRKVAPHPALVVALHGCYQSAAHFAQASGWVAQAERLGLILLLPEQQFWNNPMRCLNWFGSKEAHGGGEVASIMAMIGQVTRTYPVDRRRVFITGLSGGGAMASLMLATSPDTFAGGGIVAGIPARCASNAWQGALCMAFAPDRTAQEWGDRVRQAVSPPRHWPRVSIWQGSHDWVVNPDNARELVEQWRSLHGVDTHDGQQERVDGHQRLQYRLPQGDVVVEEHRLDQGHGQSVDPSHGCGRQGLFFPDTTSCVSERLTQFWGLEPGA